MQAVAEAQPFVWPPLLSRALHAPFADEHGVGAAASAYLLAAQRLGVGDKMLDALAEALAKNDMAAETALLRWRAPLVAALDEAHAESLLLSWSPLDEALDKLLAGNVLADQVCPDFLMFN